MSTGPVTYTVVNHIVEFSLIHGTGRWVTWPQEIGTDRESARKGYEALLASKRARGGTRVRYRIVKRTAVITDEVILEEQPEEPEEP